MPPRGVAMMIAPDARARTGAGAHQTEHFEHAERLTDAGAADSEPHGELALGRKAIAGSQASFEEVVLDALEDEPPRARGRGGRGRVDASSSVV